MVPLVLPNLQTFLLYVQPSGGTGVPNTMFLTSLLTNALLPKLGTLSIALAFSTLGDVHNSIIEDRITLDTLDNALCLPHFTTLSSIQIRIVVHQHQTAALGHPVTVPEDIPRLLFPQLAKRNNMNTNTNFSLPLQATTSCVYFRAHTFVRQEYESDVNILFCNGRKPCSGMFGP